MYNERVMLKAGTPAHAREASWPRDNACRDGAHSPSYVGRRTARLGSVEAATLQVIPGTLTVFVTTNQHIVTLCL